LDVFRHESVAILDPMGWQVDTSIPSEWNSDRKWDVRILGMSVERGNLKEIRGRVGLVFQNPEDQLFCPTVFEDVAFGPVNMGLEKPDVERRVERALETMG